MLGYCTSCEKWKTRITSAAHGRETTLVFKCFSAKQCSLLGVDISSNSVKIVAITQSSHKYYLEGYGRILLPDHAMEGDVIKDSGAVASCIKQLLITLNLSCKQAAIAVPDASTISKIIQIHADLSAHEVEAFVEMEVDSHIPYPIDEINFDFTVLGPSAKQSSLLDVLIVASRSANISQRVEVLHRAGLLSKLVDVDSYATLRAVQHSIVDLVGDDLTKRIAVVDIGVIYTHLFIMHGIKRVFSREEVFGWKELIGAVMQRYNLTQQAAIEFIEKGNTHTDYVEEVLRPFHELMVSHVKRALQFFFSTSQYTGVDYILLAGGMVNQLEIADLLQEQFHVFTDVAKPFSHMNLAKNVNRDRLTQDSPMLMVACGLALRQV